MGTPKESRTEEFIPPMEIERKYTLRKIPENLDGFPMISIQQLYLPNGGDLNYRIRKETAGTEISYTFTIKKGHGLQRIEINTFVDSAAFELAQQEHYPSISKTRYFIPLESGFVAHLDQFHGPLEGRWLVEVEFPSKIEANLFPGHEPEWFGTEVTDVKGYGNASLARKASWPEEDDFWWRATTPAPMTSERSV